MSSANAKMNPFPGLRPFTQEEDYLFFGREEQTLELLQRLGSNRFVAVVGTSGSGKSSLVRCGLLSELLGGRMLGAGSSWEIAVTHPGGNPLELLTDSLLEADLYDREEEHARENLLATLSRSHFGLVEAVKQADLGEGTNFLLVVDQFEEIFRFQDAGQRQQEVANEFVSLLLEAVAQKEVPIYVVLTMRSDFIGECGQFEGLAEMVNKGEFLIPRLTREQYKRVIEGPIKVAGGQIAPRLLQRLLNDLGQQADQLPCLQHALMRTWDVWAGKGDSEALDLDDYQRVGRMAEALSLHADEIYDSLASDRQRELCKGIFQALTVEESNSRGIRRPQRLGRLCQILEVPADELIPMIDAYRHRGVTFLMPSPDVELTESTIIDISHESLMRVWTRLRQWVEEESQAAGIYHRLAESAALHELGKAGLYRDPELGIALAWQEAKHPNAAWAERYRPGFAAAIRFLEASQQTSVAEEQAREAARQRELAQAQQLAEAQQLRLEQQQHAARKLRKLIAGVACVALIAGIACVMALVANDRARKLAVVASSEKDKAELNAKEAEQAKRGTELALIQVEAEKGRAEGNLRKAELAEKRSREFRYATDIELAARMVNDKTANAAQLTDRLDDFDPKMNKLAAAADDMRGFEWYYLKKLLDSRSSLFSGFNKPVIAAVVTPEGVLATLGEEAQVRRMQVATKQERGAPTDLKQGRNIGAKALSPDGQRVAIALGNEVQIFDAVSGEPIGRSMPVQVRGGVIFSPDSRMLITMDTGIGWWDVESGKPIAFQDFQLTTFSDLLQPLSTSADGLTLAVGGQGAYRSAFSVFRLNSETREITRLIDKIGAQGTKRAMALSPDGGTVAISLYFQGGIYVYETASGKLLQALPSAHSSAISAIAFAAGSTQMVTASLDGTIKLWNDYRKLDPEEANTFIGHAEEVNLLAILPGDKQLLSASSDKTVRFWNLGQRKTELHQELAGAMGSPRASFSSDGRLIAAPGGLTGNRLRIWDAATGQPAMELPAGSRADLSADSVAFSPDGRLLAAGYGGGQDVSYIELWDIERRERIAVLPGSTAIPGFTTDENSGAIPGLAFSPDGKHLVAAFGSLSLMSKGDTGNFPLLVYDVANQQVVRRLEGHRNYCMAVAFSRDGSRMASASQDGTARIWDTGTWRELQVLHNPDTASEAGQRRVYDVAFSPNGALLAIASAEGNVILFDVASGAVLQKLRGHANAVHGVAFAPDGLTLASGSPDGTIRLWNTATWRELLRLEPENGFTPYSISFSPHGDRLLASEYGTGGTLLWSISRDGSKSGTTTDQLAKWLHSNIDFRHRIRLLSDDLQLHEPLAMLAQREPNRTEVQAALAATRAHWHAERSEWGQSVEQFDRLKLLSPEAPQDWLRTPGLLRLATALLHEGRSADAASLLTGGETQRAEDGNGTRSRSLGIAYDASAYPAKLTQVFRGSPAWNGGLRVGDTLLKINDVEMTSENRAQYQDAMQNPVEGKLSITFQHAGRDQPETAEIMKASHIQDDLTVELIEKLLAAVNQQLSESANDSGLLELRAELAGQSSEHERQVADYTAALAALSDRPKDETAADLQRLYGRRGNAYVALGQWQSAIKDYAQAITDQTTDEGLLANQAIAQAEVSLGAWTVLKPAEMKSEGGATLTLLNDGSILSSGKHPDRDDYIVTAPIDVKNIRAIALDVLPHESLGGNVGRGVTGQFIVTELKVFGLDNAGTPQPIQLNDAVVDYAQVDNFGNWDGRNVINGNTANLGWNVQPQYKVPHRLVMKPDQTIADGTMALKFVIQQHHFNNFHPQGLLLGCFRLSVSGDPAAFDQAPPHFAAKKLTDPWQKLAAAYRIQGNQQAIDSLVARRPQSAGLIGDLFITGEGKDGQRAIAIYSQGITPETTVVELLSKRVKAYEVLKDWSGAAADWSRAAKENPAGARLLAEFASRLSKAGQHDLAAAQRERAREILEKVLQADPDDAPAIDALAALLLDMSAVTEWTTLQPAELKTQAGQTLAVQEDDSLLVEQIPYTITLTEPGNQLRAIRIETSPDETPPAASTAPFTEYQILSTDLPESGFRGRYVRIDLPGDNSQFVRRAADKDRPLTLAEVQVFRDAVNIARSGRASQSSTGWGGVAAKAIDGHTDGNFNNARTSTHTVENDPDPWWELDLGSEQPFERVVIWNRTPDQDGSDFGNRLKHFRLRILSAERQVLYERVIQDAPNPSTGITRQIQLAKVEPDAADAIAHWQISFNSQREQNPWRRLRISVTDEQTTVPEDVADTRNIPQPVARLAAAYDLNGASSPSADWFRRALDAADKDGERKQVLSLLSNHPRPLAELLEQSPDDIDLQLALARRHVKAGQKQLTREEPQAALTEFQVARDLFTKLLDQNSDPKWVVLTPVEMESAGGATLTLLDDGSILASGNNPDHDTYTLTLHPNLSSVTAIRLETLPDDSLPQHGSGRSDSGNFALTGVTLQRRSDALSGTADPVTIQAAVVDYSDPNSGGAEDGLAAMLDSSNQTYWSADPVQGQSHVAIFQPETTIDIRNGMSLIMQLQFLHPTWKQHGLGRFRLSLASEPNAFNLSRIRLVLHDSELAAVDVAIGQALAQQDRPEEAAAAFARALDRIANEDGRKQLIAQFQEHPASLAILAEQRPQDLALQLALAKRLAQSGQAALASNRQDEALPQLTKARELFASLAAKHPEPQWTVLQPTEMKSEVGAKMDLQDDGSVFVYQVQPAQNDTYTLVLPTELKGITGLRLEVLADSRLPGGGPGCCLNGNFVLSELTLQAASSQKSEEPRSIALRNPTADFSQTTGGVFPIGDAIDGRDATGWAIVPEVNRNHTAVFELDEPVGDGKGTRLTLQLRHKHVGNDHNLGRFRLSVTSGPNAIEAAQFRQDLKSSGLMDLDASFAMAYALQGRLDEAADAYARVLDLAIDFQARAKTISEAAANPGVLEKLALLKAEDAPFLDTLARHYQQEGDLLLAREAAMKARALYEAKLVAQPHDSKLAGAIADLLTWASPQEWTVLQPTELQSAGGASLTLLKDGSILASGNNASGDAYTLVADGDRKIAAVRLEVLPDDSLPNKGPGRHPTGNFQLKAVRMFRSRRDTNEDRIPIPLQSAVASFAYSADDADVRGTIDDSIQKVWHVWGRFGESHVAQFLLQQPVAIQDGEKLTIVLEYKDYAEGINLGRFRISTSSDPGLFDADKRRMELQQYASARAKLAAAYQTMGEPEKALATLSGALKLAASDSAKVALAQEAAISEELFAQLLQQSPDDPWLRLGQAKYQGKKLLAEGRTADAVQVLTAAIETAPHDLDLLNQRSGAHMKLAQWQAAAADYARILELETDHGRRRAAESLLAEVQLRLGNFQAGADGYFERMLLIPSDEWALRDAAAAQLLASTSGISQAVAKRFLEKSGTSKNKDLAQWLVRIHVARPGLITKENSPKLLEAAKVAESPWTEPMMAAIHYRLGDLKQAEPLLTQANGDSQFQALAAMLLYDQGKTDEARALLSNSSAWLDRERSVDPGSAIPRRQYWPTWTVNAVAWREAARKLIGPRIIELDALLVKEPDHAPELLQRVRLLADAGLHEDALRDFDRLVALKVNSLEAAELHGRILAGLNRNEEALPLLNQAIEAGSQDAGIHAARGEIFRKQGETDLAQSDLQKSLDLNPNEAAARSLADLLLAEVQKKSEWTVLKPTEMKSEGGATLTLQGDNSVLAGGKNTLGDVYFLTAEIAEPVRVTAIRLEALTDPSLPNNGPGRDENRHRGNFDMVGFQATARASGSDVVKVPLNRGTVNTSSHLEFTVQHWNGSGGIGQAQTAWYELGSPLEIETGSRLHFEMRFSANSEWPLQNLGRFRLSVSADPIAFNRERMRSSAMKLTNPWTKLAAAYDILGDQSAVSRLLEQHPEIAIGLADIGADAKDWDSVIAAYNRLITFKTTDVTLLSKRAAAYIATEQWELAKADWIRVIAQQPDQLQPAFETFRNAERWTEATLLGSLLLKQRPEDSMLWVQVPPIIVMAQDDAAYRSFCQGIVEGYRKAPTGEAADRAIKGCLLRPGVIDLGELPGDLLAQSLNDGTLPEGIRPWGLLSLALLKYRSGDAESAVKHVTQSEQLKLDNYNHALNLAVLASAQHQLKHPDEARQALDEAAEVIQRLQAIDKNHHDLLIAEILFREAEALTNKKEQPKESDSEVK